MQFRLRNDIKGRGGVYYIVWTDEHGRSHRASTGTRDCGEAQRTLARFILEHDIPRNQRPESVTLDAVLVRYWHGHGQTRFAKEPIRYAIKNVTEFLPRMTVAEFDKGAQRRFIAALSAQGKKGSTIARFLAVIQAALNRAKDNGELAAFHAIQMPEIVESEGVAPFSAAELRTVLEHARTENERLLCLIWISTACRPGAALDLTWDRLDFQRNVIDFRVPGRRVTKKRRTIVPMAPTLAAYLRERRSVGPVVARKTKKGVYPITTYKAGFKRLLKRAGLTGSAYRVRKGVATYLREQAVSEADILGMLGHRFGASETERYARPGHMAEARNAIENLLREIAPDWLGVARNWRVEIGNSLINRRAANDG